MFHVVNIREGSIGLGGNRECLKTYKLSSPYLGHISPFRPYLTAIHKKTIIKNNEIRILLRRVSEV